MVHAALSGTARLVAVFALAFASSLITLGASARLLRQTNMASCPINLATFCSTLPQKLFTNPCDPTCNSYINCKVPAGGAGSEQYCPAATPAFNQAQQYCDYAAKVVCNSTSASPPIPAAAAPPPKALSSPSPSKITPSPPPPPPRSQSLYYMRPQTRSIVTTRAPSELDHLTPLEHYGGVACL